MFAQPCCNMCGEDSTRSKFSVPPSPPVVAFILTCTHYASILCAQNLETWNAKILQQWFAKNPERWNSTPGMCLLGWHLQLALCVYSIHCCITASCAMFACAWVLICMSRLEMCISTSLSCEDLIYESRKPKQIHKYIVNVVSINLVGDPGT